MNRLAHRRNQTLIKVYLGLLAIAVLLCGVLVQRHISALFRQTEIVQIPAETRDLSSQRGYLPTINWGGGKR